MKCTRCLVDKSEVAFISNDKLHKICNLCRERSIIYYENTKLNILPKKVELSNLRKEALTKGKYICSKCREEKDISYFSTNANSSKIFKLGGQCKVCRKYTGKFSKIKTQYNLTKEQFLKLIEDQNGKCKICHIDVETFSFKNNKSNTLCIDHDHTTGVIRGFLCNNCNRALGLFNDNPNILLSAFKYLAHFKQEELLENPTLERQKEDNQQPSLESNFFEGSTTNSQIQTDNAEDSNANTSILQSKRVIVYKTDYQGMIEFNKLLLKKIDDIV